MAEPKFKPQYRRLLFIDGEIRKGRCPNCTGLAREWEVSPRTIQRDIDYLKWELAAPIEYDAVRHGFYYTDRSWFLPSIMLTEGDILGLLIGTQAAAMYEGTPMARELQAIYGKLAALLPGKVSLPPELISERVSFVGPPSRTVDGVIWRTVLRGLMAQQELEVEYRSANEDEQRARVLRPYHLLNLEGEWYVVASDPAVDGIRQFAVSRIRNAVLTDRPFEIPVDFDVKRLVRNRFGKFLRDDTERAARVRLQFSRRIARHITETQWHPDQRLTKRRNGSVVLDMPAMNVSDLMPWVLSFGRRVRVLAPKAFRTEVQREMCSAARQYGRCAEGQGQPRSRVQASACRRRTAS